MAPKKPEVGLIPAKTSLPAQKASVQRLVEMFLSGRSPNTLRAYRDSLQDFAGWMGCTSNEESIQKLFSLTQGEANALILDYRNYLTGKRHLASATANSRLAAVRSVVKLGRMLGMISWTIDVESLKTESYRDTRGCGDDVIPLIKDLEAKDDRVSCRDLLLVLLLYLHGLRREEASTLDLEHYDPKNNRLWIKGKGRTQREPVTLTEATKKAVDRWIRHRGTEPGALLKNFEHSGLHPRLSPNGIWRIIKRLGLGRPHGLRHAGITAGLDETKDPRSVQRFSRHKDIRVIMKYDDNRQDLGAQVSKKIEERMHRIQQEKPFKAEK